MRFNKAWTIAAFAVCFSSVSLVHAQDKKAPAASAAAPATTPPATDAKGSAAPAKPTEASATSTPGPGTAPASPAPGAATGTTPPAPAAANGSLDGSTYVVRLRDLEQRIDELKEQIRRSHTRLSLLSDTILSGGVGGARAEIAFKNDISNAFRLTGAVFVLDGVVQYNKQDDSEAGLLASQREIPIFSGSIPPGDHSLQVVLHLHGYGYGVFSYLRSYKFDVRSSHTFTVTEGKTVALDVIAWEKGDVTTPLEQRPAIRFTENMKAGGIAESAPPPPAAPAATPPAAGSVSGGVSVGTGAK